MVTPNKISLKNLISLRQSLGNIDIRNLEIHINNLKDVYTNTINQYTENERHSLGDLEFGHNLVDELLTSLHSVILQTDRETKFIKTCLDNIDKKIELLTTHLLYSSFLNDNNDCVDNQLLETYENEKNLRYLKIEDSTRQYLKNIIAKYTGWQYPALEIGCGNSEYTEWMVAADPLYVTDLYQEAIDTTLGKFNKLYQRRIRPYLIDKNLRIEQYARLPKNQLGFIFSWNTLAYYYYHELGRILKECSNLLRPGGVMFFDFNDCDTPIGAHYVDARFKPWMNKKLIRQLADEVGLEILDFHRPEEDITTVTLKKPGVLTSLRAHQTLGEIVNT
jgi:SAM-dependent methyltransferase